MQKIIIILFYLLNTVFSQQIYSATVVDVYGTNSEKEKILLAKYGKEIEVIENNLMEESKKISNHKKINITVKNLLENKKNLIDKIKKEFGFYFFDIDTVYYPDENKYFTTMEVIEQNDKRRHRFVSKSSKQYPTSATADLISKMIEYEQLDTRLVLTNQLIPKPITCPVYHCINGFDHPQLKPYLQIFNKGVLEQKEFVINTLNKDNNPARRAAAALLIGHFQNAQEIISLLTPHIIDADLLVRNNTMRVIGATLEKSKLKLENVMPFITLLDSPYVEERNKALFVLLQASNTKFQKEIIVKNGAKQLLVLLQLKQPNNSDISYLILKQISGKKFDKQDYKAWKNWINQAQSIS